MCRTLCQGCGVKAGTNCGPGLRETGPGRGGQTIHREPQGQAGVSHTRRVLLGCPDTASWLFAAGVRSTGCCVPWIELEVRSESNRAETI